MNGIRVSWTPRVNNPTNFPLLPTEGGLTGNDLDDHRSTPQNRPSGKTFSPAQEHMNSKARMPVFSTRNNGKVVLLTGATGPGHFSNVSEFFAKITNNRLDYVNAHGAR